MPLLYSKKLSDDSAYAVWKISETKWVLDELNVGEPPKEIINQSKRAEWIVTRILVQNLCVSFDIPYQGVGNHETGKPFLVGHDAEISITHSYPMAAAMIHLKKPCGIDMEWPRQKLISIQNKFIHDSEKEYKNDVDALCRIWMCKEVLFKVQGRKELSLKDEMRVKLKGEWSAEGTLLLKEGEIHYQIGIEDITNYLIAYNI